MKNKLMILDGYSILFRAFYAMPPLKNKKGQYTNAVYGFLSMLYKLLDSYSPEYICVAFDPKTPTFRHEQYSEYKAGRAKAPDELVSQFDLIRETLKAHNIECVEINGFEADDVAGTLANLASKNDMEVYLVTSDKDYLQLVDDDVKVLLTKKGATNIKVMDRNAVMEDYEITPEQFVDLKALMGDQSDNIPGVKGVGEKTAIKLIKDYHDLDTLYDNIDDIKGKLKEKLENDKMQAYMSKTLAKIVTDIPVDVDFEDFKKNDPNDEILYNLYEELGFKNFKKRIHTPQNNFSNASLSGTSSDSRKSSNTENISNKIIENEPSAQFSIFDMHSDSKLDINSNEANVIIESDDTTSTTIQKSNVLTIYSKDDYMFSELLSKIEKSNRIALKFIFDGERALYSEAVALSISCFDENIYYIDLTDETRNDFLLCLKLMFENESLKKYSHDLKSDIIYLLKHNISLKGICFDSEIAKYILDPSENSYGIHKLAYEFLDLDIPSEEDYLGKGKGKLSFKDLHLDKKIEYLHNFINSVVNIEPIILEKINEISMQDLFFKIEMPLIEVLANMEFLGFKVNAKVLDDIGIELNKKIAVLENKIYESANQPFNINSPKQLGVILFEDLGLPVIKKTKTGYSTDVEVLDKLKKSHPIANLLIEYRQLTKLNSTYVEGLKSVIDKKDDRIHSVLNQTITTTGRISSTEPNLQNIPTRTAEGREIRKAFIAEDGYVLVDADYSQIELRVLAELSSEEKLIEAFKNNEDIHTKTASEVFKTPMEEVTSTMRSRAKAVNFGIIYGISDYGLSKDLDIPRKEAKEYIESYLAYYDKIDSYMNNIIAQSKHDLYVETYFKRRRYIPELESRNFNIRAFGERIALNTPVQGTAADIIKIAMINVYKRLKQDNLKSRLLLQVHDELIIEAHNDEVELVKNILVCEMESVVKDFKVHLKADVNVGDSWYESK